MADPIGAPAREPAAHENQRAAPVTKRERNNAIDVLRGFAILGILPVNILYFGIGVDQAGVIGSAADDLAKGVVHVLFESKFITLFSLLFGAGIVMMDQAAIARGRPQWTGRFYRRTIAMLLLGFAHAYLLWYGDILFTYALIACAAFWIRGLDAKWLALIGGSIFVIGLGAFGWIFAFDSGEWGDRARELAAARGSFGERIAEYALIALYYQTIIFAIFSAWFNTGLILIGMALAKSGFFRNQWRYRSYARLLTLGFLIALPVLFLAHTTLTQRGSITIAWAYANLGLAPFLSLTYAVLVMEAARQFPRFPVIKGLAGVGRTALSNYLLQSVVCVWIFYGGLGGLGLIGRFEEAHLLAIVAAIWVGQTILTAIWLRVFRFGPAEWAWRSITYLKPQPLFRAPAVREE